MFRDDNAEAFLLKSWTIGEGVSKKGSKLYGHLWTTLYFLVEKICKDYSPNCMIS